MHWNHIILSKQDMLELFYGEKIIPKETLNFFDEIQDEELELNNYYNHITKMLFFYNISFYIS